jgi:hypothetical protein
MSRGARSALAALSAVCCLLPSPVLGQSPAVLRQADVRIALTSANACDVTADLTIESKSRVEVIHRLQLFEGARAELGGVSGAGKQAGVPRLEGRTMVLGVALDPSASGPYTIRYRVTQPDEWSYRCPIWVPVTPTDGRVGAVRLQIDVPPGTVPTRGSFPAFTWTQSQPGTASIGHVPAFVRVPFMAAGHDPGWWARQDLATLTDTTAIAVLVIGTVIWVWRARVAARASGR